MLRGPLDLVLVRHGESEGNLAQYRSKRGYEKDWEGDFAQRHSSKYRLTDDGRKHSIHAGQYIREHIAESFDMYYTSEYIRALETASLLGLENADWFVEYNLRERDKGVLNEVSKAEMEAQFADELNRRNSDLFYWCPPGGESIAGTCLRVQQFLRALEKKCAGLRVLVVCHGTIMECFKLLIERMTQADWIRLRDSEDPHDKIHHGQIVWYSRRRDHDLYVHNKLRYVKSVCPWYLENSKNEWEEINPVSFKPKHLNERAQTVKQLVNNKEEDENLRKREQDAGKTVVCGTPPIEPE